MGPMLIILTAPREQEVPLNVPNEELNRNTSDLHTEMRLEVQNREKHEDEGTVVEQPRGVPPERTFGDDHISEETHETTHSGTPRGGCR